MEQSRTPLVALVCKGNVPTGVNLNRCSVSRSCIRWHSDNEPLFGPQNSPQLIVSLSLGNSVEFKVRRAQGDVPSSIRMDHGDILVMDGLAQPEYEHRTASGLQGHRVNLTYRWVTQHIASCPLAGAVGCAVLLGHAWIERWRRRCDSGHLSTSLVACPLGSRWLGWGEALATVAALSSSTAASILVRQEYFLVRRGLCACCAGMCSSDRRHPDMHALNEWDVLKDCPLHALTTHCFVAPMDRPCILDIVVPQHRWQTEGTEPTCTNLPFASDSSIINSIEDDRDWPITTSFEERTNCVSCVGLSCGAGATSKCHITRLG